VNNKKQPLCPCLLSVCALLLTFSLSGKLESVVCSLLLGLLGSDGSLGGTTDLTSSAGSDKTSLLTGGGVSSESGGVTNMLLVTTTVGMVDGVHGDTTDTGPSVSLGLVLPEGAASLEEGLVGSCTASNNTNHGAAVTLDSLAETGGKSDSGLSAFVGVADNDAGGTGSSSEGASVTVLGLNVGDDGAFGHHVDGHNIADGKSSFLASVDEHTAVHTLDGNEVLGALFVFVLVSEANFSKRCTSAGVVDNVLHNTLNVTLSLGIVDGSEAGGSNSPGRVSLENCGVSVTLSYRVCKMRQNVRTYI